MKITKSDKGAKKGQVKTIATIKLSFLESSARNRKLQAYLKEPTPDCFSATALVKGKASSVAAICQYACELLEHSRQARR
eukprot:3644871-Amphidinium_carterae.1